MEWMAGGSHSGKLNPRDPGTVGSNTYGQLGDGTIVSKTNFTQAVAVWGGAVNVTDMPCIKLWPVVALLLLLCPIFKNI